MIGCSGIRIVCAVKHEVLKKESLYRKILGNCEILKLEIGRGFRRNWAQN
jgi:hypothetical protein